MAKKIFIGFVKVGWIYYAGNSKRKFKYNCTEI